MNISFMLTKQQFKDRSKTVTRRLGWRNLRPEQILNGVEKSQGLKKGEKIVVLGRIRVVSVRREKLRRMTDDVDYGFEEVAKEGFAQHTTLCWPSVWVPWFCSSHKGCTPETEVTRIEFEYL